MERIVYSNRQSQHGERKYGEMYSQAIQDASGYSYEMLRKAVWVSSKVQLCNRLHNLSWTHHHEVASLEPEQQREMLRQAVQVWTV